MGKALNVSLAVTADTSQAKAQLQQLQQTLSSLSGSSAGLRINVDSAGIKEASNAALELGVHLKQATSPDTGVLNFTKLNNSIKASGQTLSSYGKQLLSMGQQGQQAFSQLATAVAKSEIPMKRLSGMLGNFRTVIANTLRWQISSSVIHGVMGSISTAYNYAKDLNKSLTDIQIVTQASDQHMAQFAEQANKAAKALSTTTTAYTKASLIYYQQGLSDKEVKERTDVTVKMANITGQTAQEVSNQMTAIWNNFAKGGENLEYYADVITALGAATASSSEEISTGLQKFAAIADTVGLSYENATAALATITATTRQSADSVGTGLRTVFSRLQSLKLGETLEDGVDLTKYSKALATIGVNVLDANGNLRDMDNILADMMDKWNGLTQAQKTALAQTVGGVRQYTTIMALMENSDFYKENLQVAKDSKGTVAAQQAIYEKSWKASTDRLRASFETIYSSILNDKFFIGLNNTFSKLLNFIHQITESLGGFKGVLTSISSIMMTLFSNQMTKGLYNFGMGVRNFFTSSSKLQAERDNFLKEAAASALGYKVNEKDNKIYDAYGRVDQLAMDRRDNFSNYLTLQQQFASKAAMLPDDQKLMLQSYLDMYDKTRQDWEQSLLDRNKAVLTSVQAESNLKYGKGNGLGFLSAAVNNYNKSEASKEERAMLKNLRDQDFLTYDKTTKKYSLDGNKWMTAFDDGIKNITSKNYAEGLLKSTFTLGDFAKAKPVMEEFFKDESKGAEQLAQDLKRLGFSDEQGGLINKILTGGKDGKAMDRSDIQSFFTDLEGNLKSLSGKDLFEFGKMFNVDPKIIQDYIDSSNGVVGATTNVEEAQKRMAKAFEDAKAKMAAASKTMQTAEGVMYTARGVTSLLSMSSSIEGLIDNIYKFRDGTEDTSDKLKSMLSSIANIGLMGTMGFSSLAKGLSKFKMSASQAVGWAAAITAAFVVVTTTIEVIDRYFESASEKQERLAKGVTQATTAAKEAKQSYENLLSSFDNQNNLLVQLNELTEGTIEFKEQLLEANEAAMELIENYNLVRGRDYTYLSNGAIKFTQHGQTSAQQRAYDKMIMTQQNKQMAKILNDNETQKSLTDFNKNITKNNWETAGLGLAGGGLIAGGTALAATSIASAGGLAAILGTAAAGSAATGVGLPIAAILGIAAIIAGGYTAIQGYKQQEQNKTLREERAATLALYGMTEEEYVQGMATPQGQNRIMQKTGDIIPYQTYLENKAATTGNTGITDVERVAVDYVTSHLTYDWISDMTKEAEKIYDKNGKLLMDMNGRDSESFSVDAMQKYTKLVLGEEYFESLSDEEKRDVEGMRNAIVQYQMGSQLDKIYNNAYQSSYNLLEKYGLLNYSDLTPVELHNRIGQMTSDYNQIGGSTLTQGDITTGGTRQLTRSRGVVYTNNDMGAYNQFLDTSNDAVRLSYMDYSSGEPITNRSILKTFSEAAEIVDFEDTFDPEQFLTNPEMIQKGIEIAKTMYVASEASSIMGYFDEETNRYDVNALKADNLYDSYADHIEETNRLFTILDEALVHLTDVTEDQVEAAEIENATDTINDSFYQATKQMYEGALHSYTDLSKSEIEDMTTRMIDENNTLSISDIEKMSEMIQYFGTMVGKDFGSYIAKALDESWLQNNDKSFYDSLATISLTGNRIEDTRLMQAWEKRQIKANPENAESYIDTYRAYFKSIGGEKGLFEEIYQAEDFQDSLKSLEKEFKKTGKLTSTNIEDIADAYEPLRDMLDESLVTSQGLADAFASILSGDINVDQLTSGLLRAFSVAGGLEETLTHVYSYIDNYQFERSVLDAGEFYDKLINNIQTSQNKMLWYDKPVLQGWEEFFGRKGLDKYQEWIENIGNMTPEEIKKSFQENFAEEMALLREIQETGTVAPLYQYWFKNANLDKNHNIIQGNKEQQYQLSNNEQGEIFTQRVNADGELIDKAADKLMHFDEETGQVVIDNEERFAELFSSEAEFIDYLTNNLGVPEEMANQMTAMLAAAGPGHQLWSENEALAGIEEFKQALKDGEVITMDALNAYDKLYGAFLPENWRQELIDFAATTEGVTGAIINLSEGFDTATASYQDLVDEMDKGKESGGMGLEDYINSRVKHYNFTTYRTEYDKHFQHTLTDNQNGQKDLQDTIKAYEALGIAQEDAVRMMNESGQSFAFTIYDTATATYRVIDKTNQAYQDWAKSRSMDANDIETQLAYIDYTEIQREAEDVYNGVKQAAANNPLEVGVNAGALQSAVQSALDGGSYSITVNSANVSGDDDASGMNNAKGTKGFGGGKHSNADYEGPAIVGELGPEAWVHNNQVDLVGQHGREMIYVHPGDQIFTAAQTREIPGFKGGKTGTNVGFGDVHVWDDDSGSNADSGNAKTSKWEPERYHLITRQLKDLEREYDRLNKIKENCYGTNKLEAIQREIDATNDLITGQKSLIREAEDYLKIDAGRLKDLLDENEFQVDANGNLLNFEELQQKYRKAAEEDKDEHAQDIWKALQQYEETVDKLQEANVEMQDLLYQEMELRLEKITTKVEMRIDFDDREIKLLDHYIERIDDNIYHTAEVLALTEQKLGHINQKINDTKQGITELFEEMSDSQGNKITKDDGTAYTLEEWLAMSKEERDLLDINDNFGKQLEEYMDSLLDYIEELEEFKTKGVEEFADAFSELNDNVRSSIDLFDHYNQLLSSLKNITQLQGVKLSAEMKTAMKEIDAAMFNNTQNNIDVERENYRRLSASVADLRQKVAETTDETLKKQWEEQLKVAEEELRTSEQNLLSLWETGLQQAQDMFMAALQDAADEYEAAISGMYGTTDELQKAWNQQKKNDEFYVKDYEKYYQISKLQRSITKDLDAAARVGNKQNKGLKKLYDDLNAARENGVELSAYDLDIFEKRYEYEKALMELEDARNNKSEVRLQRDANGNWGYVYTSAADEDDLIAKQQAVDDKFYELQKATQDRVAALSDDMMSEITGVGKRLQELYSSGASEETIAKYLEQESKYIENYRRALAKALEDAGMTEEEARLRYGNEGFDILDQFSETLLSSITGGNESLDEFFARVQAAIEGTNHDMETATGEYQDSMDAINKWFNESGEDLATVIHGFASVISEESDGNLLDSKEQIQNAKDTFDEILRVATQFEQQFLEIYQPIIDANEQLVATLLAALHALNREEYEGPERQSFGSDIEDIIVGAPPISGDDSESGGSSTGGPGNGKVFKEYSEWETDDSKHWRYAIYTDGTREKCDEGYHAYVKDAGDHWENDKHYNSRTCSVCKKYKQWYSYGQPGTGGCFVSGTKILMYDNTLKNIEEVLVGDYVIAYDEENNIFIPKKVVHSYAHFNTIKILDIYLSDGTIIGATACHPILTTTGWKSLDYDVALYEHGIETTPLEIGQEVIGKDHNAIINNIVWRQDIPNYTTYNITIEDLHTYIANGFIVHNMSMQSSMEKYASGGYTGNWGTSEGRMAMLHEKELILNKDDTANFLQATNILRNINLSTDLFSKGLGNIITPWIGELQSQPLDQDVHIEASFPNVVDHNEIKLAFENLVNKASQYANRKNMSAMTFQDSYINKF